MPAETEPQVARRAAIVRILRKSTIRTQDELVRALRARGIAATQSSVSRDVRDLGVVKAQERYVLPGAAGGHHPGDFSDVAGFIRGMRRAGPNLTVISTTIGAAQSVAVAIDEAHWPEVAGTVSGDDTIFVATGGATDQKHLMARLRGLFGD